MKNYTQVTCAGNQFTDSQMFVSLFLIYPEFNRPTQVGTQVVSCHYNKSLELATKASGDPVARITYLHTGGVLSRKSGGRHVPLLYTILLRF